MSREVEKSVGNRHSLVSRVCFELIADFVQLESSQNCWMWEIVKDNMMYIYHPISL